LTPKKKKSSSPWSDELFDFEPQKPKREKKSEAIPLRPALRQIGITDCPVCKHEVAVFLTKTQRPFINCGFCSVRIFYNGRESMRRLKRKMTEVGE
jgi:DNA-directed RNA polymerase subunit RPC12/RpoP